MNHPVNASTNRRDFLRSGTVASAAVTISMSAVHTFAEEKASTSANEQVTLGLVGAGGRGTGAVNDSLTINDNVKLVAVADLFPGKMPPSGQGPDGPAQGQGRRGT